ncbi:MAG: glycosyltransferase family 2 protein [Bradymonadia bacterium]
MYREHSVAVVLPAFNEDRLLPETLRGLPPFVDRIFVVDDGSTDKTVEVAQRLKDPRIQIIRHKRNQGVGRAITSGYKAALNAKLELTVVMGADNQMSPAEIYMLLDPLIDGHADYTKGNRLGAPHFGKNMPLVRRVGTRLLAYLTGFATGLSGLMDSQCGFTAVTSRCLQKLPLETLFHGYGYPNDLLSLMAVHRQRVSDIVVTPIYRTETSNLRIYKVLIPILGILLRAGLRRLKMMTRPISTLPPPNGPKDLECS